VKHLLIIFSILLLSSPVNGDNHKGETLYKWFTSSGEVWKGFGDKGTHPKYTGEVENRVPNGLGFLIFPNGGKYVGEFKDGDFHGQGTYTFVVGRELSPLEKYSFKYYDKDGNDRGEEELDDIEPLLEGKIKRFSGWKYVGEWKDGEEHGQGTKTYSKDYTGEWKDVKRDGQVILTFDGSQYEGEWKDGEEHGQGTYTSGGGEKYVGKWKNGREHGQGTYTSGDGEKYVGKWKNGIKHGQGTYTSGDGSKYEGGYKDGQEHGQGIYIWSDGGKYIGEVKNEKFWNGTFYDKDGNIKGKVVNGNGQIILSFSKGKYVGEWKDGKPWNGTFYDIDGNIHNKFVNGKKIKQ